MTATGNDASRFEAYGRVMIALKELHFWGSGENTDFWVGLRGELVVEWHGGFHPAEVIAGLTRMPAHPEESSTLRPEHHVAVQEIILADATRARFTVAGVIVELRAIGPVGQRAALWAAFEQAVASS